MQPLIDVQQELENIGCRTEISDVFSVAAVITVVFQKK